MDLRIHPTPFAPQNCMTTQLGMGQVALENSEVGIMTVRE